LTDPVLLRFLLWSAIDTGRPVQVHCGLGDPDETLRRADPAFLQPFLHEINSPVVLLHCYPYHRQAAYLAHVYPHVYLDVGLALNHVGAAAGSLLGEVLELAPFHKVLYSSDAYGLPELYFLGATLFRRAISEVLDGWLLRDDVSLQDAHDIAADIAAGNVRALYGL
jgi:predicted TIM-barrel fold metal-dependent hydrolase